MHDHDFTRIYWSQILDEVRILSGSGSFLDSQERKGILKDHSSIFNMAGNQMLLFEEDLRHLRITKKRHCWRVTDEFIDRVIEKAQKQRESYNESNFAIKKGWLQLYYMISVIDRDLHVEQDPYIHEAIDQFCNMHPDNKVIRRIAKQFKEQREKALGDKVNTRKMLESTLRTAVRIEDWTV